MRKSGQRTAVGGAVFDTDGAEEEIKNLDLYDAVFQKVQVLPEIFT